MRIVSLLPAATEMVCALGLQDQLVGVTHECDYPLFVRDLPKVTRTLIRTDASGGEIDRLVRDRLQNQRALYTLDLSVLQELQPDLIVTQALCNVCAVAEDEVRAAACTLAGTPRVINLAPQSLADILVAVRHLAAAAGAATRADAVVRAMSARIDQVVARSAVMRQRPRVALLEWLDPPFSCGHWSPELVRLAGGVEGLGREGEPSRMLRWDEVIAWQPEVVLIACCGWSVERTLGDLPLLQGVAGWEDVPAARNGRVYVTDGSQYFSRPGPRLVDSLEILAHTLHPEVHPLPNGLPSPTCVSAASAAWAPQRTDSACVNTMFVGDRDGAKMTDEMGTFRTDVELENPARPGARVRFSGVLVDTGSELSWFPADVLESIGMERLKLMRFRQASGTVLERWTGVAVLYAAGTSTGDEVVFGQPGDMVLLGSRSLEGLNVTIDPVYKRLVDAGPAPAAVAA